MALRSGDVIRKVFKKSSSWRPLSKDELNQLKSVLLEISDDFVSVCEKNGIKYCMAYGTALGSVRHRGYIPWDDDVDFFMPREDYQRFLKIADKEIGYKYYFKSVSKGDKVNFPTLHMRLKNTCYVNYGDLILTAKEPIEERGIYIDIAPLDNSCNINILRNIKGNLCLFLLFCASCINVKDTLVYWNSHNIALSEEEYSELRIKKILGKLFGIIPMHRWMRMYDSLCASNHNDKSKYLTSYCGMKNIHKGTYLRSDMMPFKRGIFEGRDWFLPKNPDAYLTIEYNDYMTVPKQENKKIHPVFYLNFNGIGDVEGTNLGAHLPRCVGK